MGQQTWAGTFAAANEGVGPGLHFSLPSPIVVLQKMRLPLPLLALAQRVLPRARQGPKCCEGRTQRPSSVVRATSRMQPSCKGCPQPPFGQLGASGSALGDLRGLSSPGPAHFPVCLSAPMLAGQFHWSSKVQDVSVV